MDRNSNEANIKPITQSRFSNDYYSVGTYLKPFQEQHAHRSTSLSAVRTGGAPSIMSLHAAKVQMQKDAITTSQTQRNKQSKSALSTYSNISVQGRLLNRD